MNSVLNQHFRETRAAAAPRNQQAVPTSIEAEFLDALPPEIRAEVLAQEAADLARQQRQQAAAAAASQDPQRENPGEAAPAPGAMLEMDPATFLASLDPQLRQTVLLEQGEQMLGQLPPDLLAESVLLAS